MSGRHAVVKPHRRVVLLVPVRPVWRAARSAYGTVTDWCSWLDAWVRARWDNRDPFVDEPAPPATVPATVVAPSVGAPVPSRPLRLSPNDAAAHLHADYPLPWQVLDWRINGDVHGQVRSLDCGPDRMRDVVELYADALGVTWREDQADEGRTVLTATGVYAGVLFIVSAVFISDDVVPLRVYAEAEGDESLTDTLTTQVIPERVLAEVLSK